jgi:hypothetical protein
MDCISAFSVSLIRPHKMGISDRTKKEKPTYPSRGRSLLGGAHLEIQYFSPKNTRFSLFTFALFLRKI